jgi:tetratricopeptide (TPR) repeat protein
MTGLAALLVLHLAGGAAAQPPEAQKLFESGKYDEVIQLVTRNESPSPEERYLAGQSALKLDPPNRDAAKETFGRLGGDENDAWTFIGRSASALVDRQSDEALAAAQQAVTLAPDAMFASYQLGLAQAQKQNWSGAAQAFEKATTIDPSFAYADYHAGTAYQRIKRVDKMAIFFERFLKLAPDAPEAPAVQAVMRSIRR